MLRRGPEQRNTRRMGAPPRLWLVSVLALVFAISTLLHSGHSRAEFGDGAIAATVLSDDLPCNPSNRDNDQSCKALGCVLCVAVPASGTPGMPSVEPMMAALASLLTDQSTAPQFRPPKFSAQV